MQNDQLTFLAIDDNVAVVTVLCRLLQKIPDIRFELKHALDPQPRHEELQNSEIDCLFLDYNLGPVLGVEVLRDLREVGNTVPVIAFSSQGNEAVAVEMMQLGAQDYLVKGEMNPESLQRAITNAMERVRLERALAEKQRELEQFVGIAAHDLKSPLTSVAVYCQSVQGLCKGKMGDTVDESLAIIAHKALEMHELVDGLLEYARIGRSSALLQSAALDDVLTTVQANVESAILDTDAALEIEELPVVQGDPLALVQLFQNLIENALTFHGDEAPVIQVSAQQQDDAWRISVADKGIGIEPEYQQLIFEALTKLYSEDETDGLGIGLAACKKIVAQHHGQIWVESTPCRGATFHVVLHAAVPVFITEPVAA